MNQRKQENPWINLIVNVAIPMYIMTKMASADKLGPLNAVLVATAFPLVYGFYDFWKNKHINKISILGLVSVALNGVFTIIQLNPFWFAVKEAAIPALIGIFVLGSVWTKTPLISMLLNQGILNTELINSKIKEYSEEEQYLKLQKNSTIGMALSFFLSAILNFGLARYIVKSQPGTEAFASELGRMTGLSFIVIAIPSMVILGAALWYLMKGLEKLTKLPLDDIMQTK